MSTEPVAAPNTEQGVPSEQEFKDRFPGAGPANSKISVTREPVKNDNKYSPAEEDEKHKKEAKALALKKAQFEKDPSQFIHQDDIVMAVINTPNGHAPFFGLYSIADCVLALGNLQFRFFTARQEFEYRAALKAQQKDGLIGPDGKPIAAPKPGGIIT